VLGARSTVEEPATAALRKELAAARPVPAPVLDRGGTLRELFETCEAEVSRAFTSLCALLTLFTDGAAAACACGVAFLSSQACLHAATSLPSYPSPRAPRTNDRTMFRRRGSSNDRADSETDSKFK
jgi:hypothetical protein